MPPRIPMLAFSRVPHKPIVPEIQTACPICTFSRSLRRPFNKPRRTPELARHRSFRLQSNLANGSAVDNLKKLPAITPRKKLHDALVDLQKEAGNYTNISRLQLALRGLEQSPGQETIRIAILGLKDGNGESLRAAKQLLRLLLADPLKSEEEWERTLLNDEPGNKPLIIRVGKDVHAESGYRSPLLQELRVSSPALNGHKLEILVLESVLPTSSYGSSGVEEAALVPTMEIPTSSTGRYTPVTTPVHKSLIVSHGIGGAAIILPSLNLTDRDIVSAAVNFPSSEVGNNSGFPIQIIDIVTATAALLSFRHSVKNALSYEQSWFASGVPEVLDWLKSGTLSNDQKMKLPLQKLIKSLLQCTNVTIEAESRQQFKTAIQSRISDSDLGHLQEALTQWAEHSHTELRDDLDIAFDGHRWRKLGWWKLFWRVDDVSMIATDILSRRFLTDAEKELIFLAGRIEQAGVFKGSLETGHWAYKDVQETLPVPESTIGNLPPPPTLKDVFTSEDDDRVLKNQPWPLDIPITRAYLATNTVPALQALAQKLVLQTLSVSSFVSAFAGLTYISTLSTGLYEAGAIAAFGIVWSLRRMQGKWETARRFWEGEVREEGRKAVRRVEGIVEDAFKAAKRERDSRLQSPEIDKALEAAERVGIALKEVEACK